MGKAKRKLKFFRIASAADSALGEEQMKKTSSPLFFRLQAHLESKGEKKEIVKMRFGETVHFLLFPTAHSQVNPRYPCSVIILLLPYNSRTLAQRNKKTRCFLLHSIPATLHHKKSGPSTHKLSAVLALLCLPGARPKNARRVTGNGPRPLPS